MRITESFTRPADTTAYASGDLVANSTTAASVVPLVFVGKYNYTFIKRVKLAKSGTGTTNALFRVHLFDSSPTTITNGDNGALSTSGVANYLGAFDVTMSKAFTDGACGIGIPLVGGEIEAYNYLNHNTYALIEARGAYTPASGEIFTLTLETYGV